MRFAGGQFVEIGDGVIKPVPKTVDGAYNLHNSSTDASVPSP